MKKLESKASFSKDRLYRFSLYRRWKKLGKEILFICLNPSTADETTNDPTVRRCINLAKGWGYRGVWVGNIFALRATNPLELYKVYDPIGRENDLALKKMADRCIEVVFAWGNHGRFLNRGQQVSSMIGSGQCFGVNQSGEPRHPLYLPRDVQLIEYPRR